MKMCWKALKHILVKEQGLCYYMSGLTHCYSLDLHLNRLSENVGKPLPNVLRPGVTVHRRTPSGYGTNEQILR